MIYLFSMLVLDMLDDSVKPAVPAELATSTALKLSRFGQVVEVNGATDYFAVVDCPVGLSNSVGLTVRDDGSRSLFVIITTENTNGAIGGFPTITIRDDDANGTIDSLNGVGLTASNTTTMTKAYTGVLTCYLNQ
jgi:hypothetical protein